MRKRRDIYYCLPTFPLLSRFRFISYIFDEQQNVTATYIYREMCNTNYFVRFSITLLL